MKVRDADQEDFQVVDGRVLDVVACCPMQGLKPQPDKTELHLQTSNGWYMRVFVDEDGELAFEIVY